MVLKVTQWITRKGTRSQRSKYWQKTFPLWRYRYNKGKHSFSGGFQMNDFILNLSSSVFYIKLWKKCLRLKLCFVSGSVRQFWLYKKMLLKPNLISPALMQVLIYIYACCQPVLFCLILYFVLVLPFIIYQLYCIAIVKTFNCMIG